MAQPIVIAMLAALPSTLAFIVSVINSRKANVIHALVNSQLTSVKSELVMANAKITELQEFIIRHQLGPKSD